MSKRKRVSLSTRLQPYSGTLVAEVVEWLNEHDNSEKNDLIAKAVVMAYLPYARASQDVSKTELERCCWETQDRLDKHGFNLRSSLQIAQPQWRSAYLPSTVSAHNLTSQSSDNGFHPQPTEGEDNEEPVPQSLIEGSGALDDGLFGDDDW
ncbi:MAG: hypothetical protein AAF298_24880 [Cyanobacteria bacterium P01_A01_bin.40]